MPWSFSSARTMQIAEKRPGSLFKKDMQTFFWPLPSDAQVEIVCFQGLCAVIDRSKLFQKTGHPLVWLAGRMFYLPVFVFFWRSACIIIPLWPCKVPSVWTVIVLSGFTIYVLSTIRFDCLEEKPCNRRSGAMFSLKRFRLLHHLPSGIRAPFGLYRGNRTNTQQTLVNFGAVGSNLYD